ncbi:triose phosphate isomerase [Ceratobasidium sp. AG-Ba]|nr:triose phosphate isomerase [Ceratobasidium sp. AG-Ba]
MARKFFVGGNFKMNGTVESTKKIIEGLNSASLDPNTEVVIAPPALYLLSALALAKPHIGIAAQNSYTASSGAFTGEISPAQLVDAKIPWVILGHSERRTLFGDTDALVADKTKAALAAGLSVILCVGETLQEREAGTTMKVVERQLAAVAEKVADWSKIVIAYEPVWAIGTGKVATCGQASHRIHAQEVHKDTREWVAKNVSPETAEAIRIIYGGSVNAGNCKESAAQPDVDGFLVGGASLKPEFVDIVNAQAYPTST